MSEIIIQLQGGLVQEVFIKGTGVPRRAVIVDEDTEGAEIDDITIVNVGRGKGIRIPYEACIHAESINRLKRGCDIDRIVKQFDGE